ncbi:MAG: penicillin-insensitive murein endopeptidase [Myxococcales bacterium]
MPVQVAAAEPALEQEEQGAAQPSPSGAEEAAAVEETPVAQAPEAEGEAALEEEETSAAGAPEVDPEAESKLPPTAAVRPGVRYTADIDDARLEQLWSESPEALGSLSIGFADAGRLVNGRQMPEGPNWKIVAPQYCWGTEETIEYLTRAINHVAAQFEGTPPLRVNHMSKPEGGWIRPHASHQSGRDVDLAFYYLPGGPDRGAWARRENFDLARNWALVRALITETDVQLILVDRQIIKRLYDYALSIGEDKAWLDSIFRAGRNSLVLHARRHRDHYHVRFYNPRAQELGRRVQPLMPKGQPELNRVVHRVRSGECLGAIARRYDTTVSAIRKANGLRSTLIRAGRTLVIPLRGPCVNCPMPPEVIVPPRRLPPAPPPVACPAVPARVELAVGMSEPSGSAVQ